MIQEIKRLILSIPRLEETKIGLLQLKKSSMDLVTIFPVKTLNYFRCMFLLSVSINNIILGN